MGRSAILLRSVAVAVVTVLAVSASACGGISDPGKNTNNDFSGTLVAGGVGDADVYSFTSGGVGEYIISITAMAPDANTLVRVYLGFPDTGFCNSVNGQTYIMKLGGTALNGGIQKGAYCVQIADPGFINQAGVITADQTYTLRVSHP